MRSLCLPRSKHPAGTSTPMPGGHDPRIHRENAVRTLASLVAVCAAAVLPMENAYSWGQEGHSIVAEIAQHRLNPAATQAVTQLLGPNVSLASISSWADDVRGARPGTYNWHFVDIPGSQTDYVPARDCQPTSAGDCIVNELMRLRTELRCGATDTIRREALKFAVHFVGDVHQPLHAIGDKKGGNAVPIHGAIHGQTCTGSCPIETDSANLHALWDSGLIHRTVWDWGAYVDRLENGWLNTDAAKQGAAGTPADWAVQSHAMAARVWNAQLVPADGTLGDGYYNAVLPVLDQQLALAGVHLAGYLNDVFAETSCSGAVGAASAAGAPAAPLPLAPASGAR
ncbi:MAG: S1/P1 nuclease [bacterium]|jgi:hypothetical protein